MMHEPFIFNVREVKGHVADGKVVRRELRQDAWGEALKLGEASVLAEELLLHQEHLLLELVVLNLEPLSLLALAFARVVGGGTVTLDAFDAPLLLFVVRLCALARRQIGLGLW